MKFSNEERGAKPLEAPLIAPDIVSVDLGSTTAIILLVAQGIGQLRENLAILLIVFVHWQRGIGVSVAGADIQQIRFLSPQRQVQPLVDGMQEDIIAQ